MVRNVIFGKPLTAMLRPIKRNAMRRIIKKTVTVITTTTWTISWEAESPYSHSRSDTCHADFRLPENFVAILPNTHLDTTVTSEKKFKDEKEEITSGDELSSDSSQRTSLISPVPKVMSSLALELVTICSKKNFDLQIDKI